MAMQDTPFAVFACAYGLYLPFCCTESTSLNLSVVLFSVPRLFRLPFIYLLLSSRLPAGCCPSLQHLAIVPQLCS